MRLIDIITDVEDIAALGTTKRVVIRRAIRHALEHYAASYDWPHYRALGVIQTLDDITTDTVSVTINSRTVTKTAGTDWPTTVAGMKFRVGSQNQWYRIRTRNSATQITLEDPYLGATASGGTYTIFQDEYPLAADCHKLLDMRQAENALLMVAVPYLDMDRLFPDPDSLSNPVYFSLIGRYRNRYTTGTIATTVNSPTLTGTSTLWLSVPGLTRGSRIAVEATGEVFTVDTIESDTSLTAYEVAGSSNSSSAYRMFLNNLRVQAWQVPDAARNLFYRYQRIPFPLVNDYDEPDMPMEYHYMLVWAGLEVAWNMKGNLAASQDAAVRFAGWIQQQIQQIGRDSPTTVYPRQSLDEHMAILKGERLPTNYGYVIWP